MRRAFFFAFVALVSVLAGGCNKPLDDDKCQKLVDKMVDLYAADQPSNDHVDKVKAQVKGDKRTAQNLKDTCIGKMTKSQYDCVMNAKSFGDATQCDQK